MSDSMLLVQTLRATTLMTSRDSGHTAVAFSFPSLSPFTMR